MQSSEYIALLECSSYTRLLEFFKERNPLGTPI